MVHRVKQENVASLGKKGHTDNRVSQGLQARKDHGGQMVMQAQSAKMDPKVLQDHKGQLARKVKLERLVHLAYQDMQGKRAQEDLPGLLGRKAKQDHPGLTVLKG